MADAESPPATEEAMLTTPDVVVEDVSYKTDESHAVDKDGEARLGAEGDRAEEGAEACGDELVAPEPAGIAEDPDQADVTRADEPDKGISMEVQTGEVSAAVDDLTDADVAPTFSNTANDSTEVDFQTYEITASSADDLSEMGAAMVNEHDSKMVSAGSTHMSADQASQEIGGVSLDGLDKASYLVSDVLCDGASMEKNVSVSVESEPAQDEGPQMDVAADMLNMVETVALKSGNHSSDEGTNVNTQVQTEYENEAEDGGTISATSVNEDGRHLVTATMSKGYNKENDIGLTSSVVPDEGIQRVIAMGGYDEQQEGAPVDDSRMEEGGMQMNAISMTGIASEEVNIGGENTADEALDGAAGMAAPEEKVQMDEADNDFPDEGAVQMDQANLTGNDKNQKEVQMADDDGVEQDNMQMDTTARTNDEDPEEGTDGEDVAEEAVDGTVGDGVHEEEAAADDDDDEPPPLSAKKGGGRRKRGRPSSKAQAVVKPSAKKKDEEEVCFICFDGGDLVVCDRRGCPKAYHPSCVNRDDDFFKSKGRWSCGWHICSNCQKPARHMCYTCTYSLCKACIKEAKFIGVRGFKGFCDTCINTVMMIENKEEATDQLDVDFDDKSSWWYLFKEYWLNLKTSLSMTVEEISGAMSQKSRSSSVSRDNDLDELPDNNDEEANSESSLGRHVENNSAKKRGRKRSKQAIVEDGVEGKERTKKSTKRNHSTVRDTQASPVKKTRKLSKRSPIKESESVGTSTSSAEEASWASEELLNFVAHMRNGDKSALSQFDVQHLLLKYIKEKKLRDPRRKSQIVCDPLLQSLFAKERVGHFEMLKLLESHFLMSDISPVDADDNHGGVVDPDPSQDADGNSEASVAMSSEKRRKSRKYDRKGRHPNLDEYAAIDNHNIGLMYLRRSLIEELISNVDSFDEKVVGAFVKIKIPGTGQRQDIYRLVQIVGTGRAPGTYVSGKNTTTDITLDILNLDKREVVTIDTISNQEFSEEECKRLRQSIKCGFIPRLTVGEVQEKARILQAVKVNEWIESEKTRLGHLRDRASDMGHRKELRECVEKLKLLSTPEERARRLNEEPEIHADPTMDPDYESPEEQEQETERSSFNKSRSSFSRKDGNLASPGKGDGRSVSHRDAKSNWESNQSTWAESSSHMESPFARRSTFASPGESAGANVGAQAVQMEAALRCAPQGSSGIPSGAKPTSQSTISESEKIWQYMDPSNKIQGPFSIVQLRKWNSSGYFPPDLKIWKASEKQDDSILLSDALMGKFEKDLPPWEPPITSSQINKNILRSNSDVGTRHRDDTLEQSMKTGELTPMPVGPNRSQSFSGRDQRHDYGTNNHGPTVIQSPMQSYYGVQNSQAPNTTQQSLAGSFNAPSQVGVAVNPMTPMQPAMGVYSAGQNIVVPGNVGNLAPVPTIAPSNAEVVNSGLPSQNTALSDRSESRLGKDASHGTVSSSDLGPMAAQTGPAQMNSQQDTRNQLSSTDASNSVMTSQLTSRQPAESVQRSATAVAIGDSQSSGWSMPQGANPAGQAQVAGNVTWATALQGDTSMGWGMMGQSNMTMPWGGAPAQGATYNIGLTMPTQPNAVPNIGWVANPGNTNMNMMWAATQGQGTPNAAAMMGAQMQGVAMGPWGGIAQGNATTYPGWGTQAGNVNQNLGWGGSVQGNPAQGNNNMNWNSSNGNPGWNNQQRDNGGGRHSGNRGGFNAGDSGGRSWKHRSGGNGGPYRPGICYQFRDQGVCTKENCNYAHPSDGFPSRNDNHMDRQHSGNDRRYGNHNERNDRQFDRQPPENEKHYDRQDSRHDDNQADKSQSREPF